MKPRINYIVLAVSEINRSLAFYRDDLGFPTEGIVGDEFLDPQTGASGEIVIFEMGNGQLLCLYERGNLAKDATMPLGPLSSTEFSLGYLVASKNEVNDVLKKAEVAGATLTQEPFERPWGVYSGYFKDPDGHLWEVTYNPRIAVE